MNERMLERHVTKVSISIVLILILTTFATAQDVPLYRTFETTIINNNSYGNKFADVILNATFTAPSSSRTVQFWGFYDGNGSGGQDGNVWKLRFLPDELGTWTYTYSWTDSTPGGAGSFNCIEAGAGKGVIKSYVNNPYWLAYNGTDPMMINSYYVGQTHTHDLNWTATNVYDKLIAAGVNHIQFQGVPSCGSERNWISDTSHSFADHPSGWLMLRYLQDYHLDIWHRAEDHLKYLDDRDVSFHFWSGVWHHGDQWYRYVCARLAPMSGVAGWSYFFERWADQGYLDGMKTYDPWEHLLGAQHLHDPVFNCPQCVDYTYGSVSYYGATWRDSVSFHSEGLRHYNETNKHIPFYMNETKLWRHEWNTADDEILRCAWGMLTGNAHFNWSWTNTEPDGTAFRNAYEMFDSMADEYMKYTYDIITSVPWHETVPSDGLISGSSGPTFCLADPGRCYIVYKQESGSLNLNLEAGTYTACWYNARAGLASKQEFTVEAAGGNVQFTTPYGGTECVLTVAEQPVNAPELTVTLVSGNEIQLQWTDPNDDPQETGVIVQRKPYHGSNQWHELVSLGQNATDYTDTDSLHGNVTYTYRVGAYK